MSVPKSLKLAETEVSSLAQLGHQVAAAAQPRVSMRDLIRAAVANDPLHQDQVCRSDGARGQG